MREERLLKAILNGEDFGETLKRFLKEELRISIREFSELSGIPESTLYKLISGEREPTLRTLRQIFRAIKRDEEPFIAIIASRSVLNEITESYVNFDGKRVKIKEYPANSFEEAIVSAVRAERDGAVALICAPIVSPAIEKIVSIPIVTIIPKRDMRDAIEVAIRKSSVW
ncbi:MAG: helix-turn-helix domain-containing protein [Archaeoglobi archaeon]|nr:helix-turn-helix domain-containing protein [Candidatus Mnemosynella bozhongmuii]